jgi:hypothetical protein
MQYIIDDVHDERLRMILGLKDDAWITKASMEQAIDDLYARLFPSLQDQQVQQEMDDHNEERVGR